MIKRAAIIDMGTNTWNLVIGEKSNDGESFIHRSKVVVQLAKGGLDKNLINEAAYSRALNAIAQHIAILNEFEVPLKNVKAVGTSAMRSMENGSQLATQIENEFGISVQIIDGNEEANLIRKGISKAIDLPDNNYYLMMDIGGGSTEFIIGNGNKVLWKESTDLGVSRLLETFQPDNPISPVELEQLQFYISSKLLNLKEQLSLYPVELLIGSSGSFETLNSIEKAEKKEELVNNAYHNLDVNYQINLLHRLKSSSLESRLDWPGLVEMRAETMHIASILIQLVISYTAINTIYVSEYALKEGALTSWLNQIQ